MTDPRNIGIEMTAIGAQPESGFAPKLSKAVELSSDTGANGKAPFDPNSLRIFSVRAKRMSVPLTPEMASLKTAIRRV